MLAELTAQWLATLYPRRCVLHFNVPENMGYYGTEQLLSTFVLLRTYSGYAPYVVRVRSTVDTPFKPT
jgi:hypothetical protein